MAAVKFSRRILARTIATKLVIEPTRQDYWIKALAGYLVDQKRTAEAELIINDILHELYEQDGQLLAHVTSARPLTDQLRTKLKHLLATQTDARKVTLTEDIDPSLIGGLVARTADAELDASVRSKINQLATIK